MAVTYYRLGGARRLHEIIFAGSHDASITSGASKAQTQNLDVRKQAEAGVRLFDMRILAHGTEDGASLVGYHGKGKGSSKQNMYSDHTSSKHDVKLHKGMSHGTTGMKLSLMLEQARGFVTDGDSKEFLIFKFDKCTNWQLIAEYCVKILGNAIFKYDGKYGGIEFSKLTLDDLSRKVVCVFNEKAAQTQIKGLDRKQGIIPYRALKSKDGPNVAYDPGFKGMQYFGKGGTDWWRVWKTQTKKMNENIKRQQKLMLEIACSDDKQSPNVLGMMYWTATGLLSSIKKRNSVLWHKKTGVPKFNQLWEGGLKKSIEHQLKREELRCLEWGGEMRIKAFFPNIIMIDFASEDKCNTIYQLNNAKDKFLAEAYKKYVGSDG